MFMVNLFESLETDIKNMQVMLNIIANREHIPQIKRKYVSSRNVSGTYGIIFHTHACHNA